MSDEALGRVVCSRSPLSLLRFDEPFDCFCGFLPDDEYPLGYGVPLGAVSSSDGGDGGASEMGVGPRAFSFVPERSGGVIGVSARLTLTALPPLLLLTEAGMESFFAGVGGFFSDLSGMLKEGRMFMGVGLGAVGVGISSIPTAGDFPSRPRVALTGPF